MCRFYGCGEDEVRTAGFLLVAISLIIFEAPDAYAGAKLGVFIPTNSDFSSSFAIGLDGRFNVSKQFKLGFDSLFIRDVTGNKYLFDKTEFFAHEEVRSDLFLLNGMVTGWYYFNESLYGGLGGGYFFTDPSKTGGEGLFESVNYRENNKKAEGPAYQIVFGYMQKPTEEKQKYLFFTEVKYLYQIGDGKLEIESGRFEKLSDFSGVAALAGVTF